MDAIDQYVDHDLGRLTQAERLWIWRRRQISKLSKRRPTRMSSTFREAGRMMTRGEAAEALGLSENLYAKLETGDALLTDDQRAEVMFVTTTMPPLLKGELCAIARKRSKDGHIAPMRALSVSKPTMTEMERAGDPRLVSYWENRGFKFPGRRSTRLSAYG